MKHGIIGENLKAFLGGYTGSFIAFFKPILLDTTSGASEGILVVAALWVLKLIGLAVISLATGFAAALGADLFKNLKAYTRFKNKKDKKDDRSQTDKAA
jgi:hypothetical protein